MSRRALRPAGATLLGLLAVSALRAQEIVIPDEFLSEEPPPLDLGRVAGEGGAGAISEGADSGMGGAAGIGLNRPALEFTTDYFGYFQSPAGKGDDHFLRADLKVKFEGGLGEDFVYTVTPQLRQDTGDNSVNGFEFRENGLRRPLATFHEASLSWQAERFQISLGKQIFNWGVSDAHNPLDDLNPRDFLDVPTNERIGVPALSIYHLHDLFEFQAVWEPWFTPSRLPLPALENRWQGSFRAARDQASAQLGFPVNLGFAGRKLPSDQFNEGQFGARLSSSTFVDGWDLALTYFRGRLPEGVFVGQLQGNTIIATLEFPRYHEIGASFATVIGSWQLHGEGSWHLTDKENLDEDYLEYVAGVNRAFEEIPIPGVQELRMILEYAGSAETRGLPAGSNSFGSRQFARPFQDAVAVSLVLKFSEETEFELSGAYDFADDGSLFQASLTHEFSDNIEALLGTDFFSGPEDSFFGKWEANDRIFLTMSLVY